MDEKQEQRDVDYIVDNLFDCAIPETSAERVARKVLELGYRQVGDILKDIARLIRLNAVIDTGIIDCETAIDQIRVVASENGIKVIL